MRTPEGQRDNYLAPFTPAFCMVPNPLALLRKRVCMCMLCYQCED